MSDKIVVISVRGGVAEVEYQPEGIKVVIKDYDNGDDCVHCGEFWHNNEDMTLAPEGRICPGCVPKVLENQDMAKCIGCEGIFETRDMATSMLCPKCAEDIKPPDCE